MHQNEVLQKAAELIDTDVRTLSFPPDFSADEVTAISDLRAGDFSATARRVLIYRAVLSRKSATDGPRFPREICPGCYDTLSRYLRETDEAYSVVMLALGLDYPPV